MFCGNQASIEGIGKARELIGRAIVELLNHRAEQLLFVLGGFVTDRLIRPEPGRDRRSGRRAGGGVGLQPDNRNDRRAVLSRDHIRRACNHRLPERRWLGSFH